MGWFSPFKKPDRFNYQPRFYDPRKEALEQRRRELRGESSENDGGEYTPGQYLRTQRQARQQRRGENSKRRNGGSGLIAVAAIVLILLVGYLLYPRIAEVFSTAQRSATATTAGATAAEEEFDPYAPITVVPNDYKE